MGSCIDRVADSAHSNRLHVQVREAGAGGGPGRPAIYALENPAATGTGVMPDAFPVHVQTCHIQVGQTRNCSGPIGSPIRTLEDTAALRPGVQVAIE